ncbi:MAG TPA: TAXI family TRAP transporter solute-binding subunit [Burkholderiales bacterium]
MLKSMRLAALAAAAYAGASGAQQTVGFATLQPGTLLNAQASVIAKVVQDHSKLQVRVIGHGGDTGIIDAVNSDQADFLLLDVGEPAEAQKGENVWKGNPKPNLRAALTLFGFQMAFWVRRDSPVQSIADLKGKNIPSDWVQQTSVITHLNALLAAGGVTMNDVKKVPTVNVIRASEDFKSGKIDVFFFAVGAPKVQEIAAAVGGLRVLNMEILPDSEARMKRIRPEYYFSNVNPAPHIAGVDKPTKVQTIDFIIGVGTHVKDDVVVDFIKAVHGNKQDLVAGHPNFNAYDPSKSGKVQPRLAYHPAAEKYWKETGLR